MSILLSVLVSTVDGIERAFSFQILLIYLSIHSSIQTKLTGRAICALPAVSTVVYYFNEHGKQTRRGS